MSETLLGAPGSQPRCLVQTDRALKSGLTKRDTASRSPAHRAVTGALAVCRHQPKPRLGLGAGRQAGNQPLLEETAKVKAETSAPAPCCRPPAVGRADSSQANSEGTDLSPFRLKNGEAETGPGKPMPSRAQRLRKRASLGEQARRALRSRRRCQPKQKTGQTELPLPGRHRQAFLSASVSEKLADFRRLPRAGAPGGAEPAARGRRAQTACVLEKRIGVEGVSGPRPQPEPGALRCRRSLAGQQRLGHCAGAFAPAHAGSLIAGADVRSRHP